MAASMLLFPDMATSKPTSAPGLQLDATKARRDFFETISKSLIVVATYLWAEALKTLFNKHGYGPWYLAVCGTCLAAVGTQYLSKFSS